MSFFIIVLSSSLCFSQKKLVFEYDAAGNQTLRNLVNVGTSSVVDMTTVLSDEPTLQIYPNPVSTDLNISWDKAGSDYVTQIEIHAYNTFGVENVKFLAVGNRIVLDMSQRPAGVYYLKIHLKEGKIINRSIIKR